MDYAYLDFEYRQVSEPNLDLVSCSVLTCEGCHQVFWLFKTDKSELTSYLDSLIFKGYTCVAFNVEAEASSLLSLGFKLQDLLQTNWLDLYLEYRMLQNHSNEFTYGKQLVDGVIKTLVPFVDQKGKSNLSAATYKLLNEIIDTKEKDEVRDIIINGTDQDVIDNKERILKYNASDVKYLPKMLEAIRAIYAKRKSALGSDYALLDKEMYLRGEYAVRTAQMTRKGYPIDVQWARNLSDSVPCLMDEAARDINSQFPEVLPFQFNKKTGKWGMSQINVKKWIEKSPHYKKWERTDKDNLSLALESWTEFYNYQHTYPNGNFGAQIVRYLKLKQSLNGFVAKGGKDAKSFWDYVGSDGRVRPYYNIYGAQSSRSQQSAIGYIFLKPAWQRTLVKPSPGKMIVGIDYSSEEFLLGALMSRDSEMTRAYKAGDVYLYFAKEIGLVPENGTKDTHKYERNLCKATVLGLSYMMTKVGLARKLSADTGTVVTEEMAQARVNDFDNLFHDFKIYREKIIEDYMSEGFHKLPCGWYMWGDNDNSRSVGNMPIQGMGACIMRKAVALCQDAGLDVIMTLHDALYIECDLGDWAAADCFAKCMKQAFISYFPNNKNAGLIRMDGEIWSEEFETEREAKIGEVTFRIEKLHIDERAAEDYKVFNKYFKNNPNLDLL